MSARLALYAMVVGLVLTVGGSVALFLLGPPPRTTGTFDRYGQVPPFTLTERSGKPISNADLAGKVWVASFVFTRCNGPCPAVTATVARLQQELKDRPDVRFVTFTVDPKRDSLDDLKRYADRYRADPDRWLFLTGDEAAIHKLAMDGFKLGVMPAANPKPGEEFDHSTRLAVVDKTGTVRGYADGFPPAPGEDVTAFEKGLADLKALVTKLGG